ncbi:unnamed protein product, partial [Symbiodinium sp. CCMP2456]
MVENELGSSSSEAEVEEEARSEPSPRMCAQKARTEAETSVKPVTEERPSAPTNSAPALPQAPTQLLAPSEEPVRRRSSLVPRELQQSGTPADVEAAKVRRAVAAAKKRVQKARAKPKAKQEKPKKKVTSRSELLVSLFNALGGQETGYLG